MDEPFAYERLCQTVEKAGLHLELYTAEKSFNRLTVRRPSDKATLVSARVTRSLEEAAADVLARLPVADA